MERINSQPGMSSSKQHGYKRSDSTASKKGFFSHTSTLGANDTMTRLNYQIKKDREMASNDFLNYEKIRWPCYKDMVLKRKHQTFLPQNPIQIKKMLGLVRAPVPSIAPVRRGGEQPRNDSSAKPQRRLDSASSQKSSK